MRKYVYLAIKMNNRMKRIIFMLVFVITGNLIYAQEMKELFRVMPDSVIPLLTKNNREDCIDFLDSNMKAEVKNLFGKPSQLKKLTKNYLFMQTTPVSSVEMKVLPVNDSTNVIGVINTYCTRVCDSKLTFYDTKWKPLRISDFINLPVIANFRLNSDSIQNELSNHEIADMFNVPYIKYSFSSDNNDIIFTNTSLDNLNSEDRKLVESKDNNLNVIKYRWNNGKFIR